MSDYILQELEKSLRRPTRQELADRIAELPSVELEPSAAEIIRRQRGEI